LTLRRRPPSSDRGANPLAAPAVSRNAPDPEVDVKRIALFVATNIAVLLVAGTVAQLLGVDRWLYARGVGLDLPKLLAFCAIFGMTGSFLSLLMSKPMAKMAVRAQVITSPQARHEQFLVATVEKHAKASGIGMPEVAIYQDPTPNAFATGARRDAALVAVSTGLLERMTPDEVDGVLAHEVSHIANGDMVTLTLIQGVVNTFVLFFSRIVGYVVDRALQGDRERGPGIGFFVASIASQIVFGVLASMIVMWFSRQREFRADAGAAQLTGAGRMIAALRRLATGPQEPLPQSLAAMGINGVEPRGWRGLLMSHPPLSDRIARLERAAGIAS
jgi:heat shock protein HtpX